jgi:steroid delta-isomerase-like uncharacterized protein
MTNENAQTVVRRFIREVFVDGRADRVSALVTDDFVSHGLPGSGPEVMQNAIQRTSKALANAAMQIEDIFGADDRVAVRLTSRATQSGEFMGMPATGRTYEIEEIHIFRVADGRVAEHWHQIDAMGMLRQLGVKG